MNEVYLPQEPSKEEKFATSIRELNIEANLDDLYSVVAHEGESQIGSEALESLVKTHADTIGLLYATIESNGLDVSSQTQDAENAKTRVEILKSISDALGKRIGTNTEHSVTRPEVMNNMQGNIMSILMNILQQSGKSDIDTQDALPLAGMFCHQTEVAYELINLSLDQAKLEGREVVVSPAMERLHTDLSVKMITKPAS